MLETADLSGLSSADKNAQMDAMMKSYIPDTVVSVKIKKNGSE